MASNRPEGAGDSTPDLNIWVATRASVDEPFGAPQELPAPINSAANDFCPTPLRGGKLLFVSNRSTAESCGQGDIYLSRLHPKKGWLDPRHLRCAPDGPNSSLDEQGPSLIEVDRGHQLFFSRSSAAPNPVVPGELFVSARPEGGEFGPATAIAELNSPGNDIQPNVRKDGLEVVFSSNRDGGLGAQDIWVATRNAFGAPWSTPVNVGAGVNTAAAESRPSLSKNARQLLFGRTPGPEGIGDIYVSTRSKVNED